ncbi:MAG: hypothetical protein WCE62_06320 [Polyangiales bacterium]
MPHPDEDPDLPGKPRRRPSHFRKKRRDTTTKLVRVSREPSAPQGLESRVVPSPQGRHKQWSEVTNPAPALPDPLLHRPLPPPAPLPSESSSVDPMFPGWFDDRQQRKRTEDIIGTVALALMVAAMLVAIWLRMTGP